jgi:hypothetical protein
MNDDTNNGVGPQSVNTGMRPDQMLEEQFQSVNTAHMRERIEENVAKDKDENKEWRSFTSGARCCVFPENLTGGIFPEILTGSKVPPVGSKVEQPKAEIEPSAE